MRTLSLRARLTLWYTVTLLVVLCLVAADVLWMQARLSLRRVDRELESLTATFSSLIQEELQEKDTPATAAQEACHTMAAPGRAFAIFDSAGTPLAASWGGLELHDPLPLAQSGPAVWTAQTPSGAWRVWAQRVSFQSTTTFEVVVASPLASVQREQQEVQEAMAVGIPLALLLAAGGGLWIASVGLRPITSMAEQAARISLTGVEDLGHPDRSDELGKLARAFNGLVTRLRAALQTQRQFMADASHELRTPVSVVRTAAEVTLSRAHRDEPEYREAIGIVGDQARRLGRLVDDMLVLARADAGGYPLRPVDLYLDEVVIESQRAVEVLAAERGVTIRSAPLPEIPFRGDEGLLRQLALNVLQNAVQHTPPGGCVTIDVTHDPDLVRIRVTDNGPGIPPADRARIFDRFVQLDPARRGAGTGLGLPIARWIAEAHQGTLVLESSGPIGSTFCVSLPGRSHRRAEAPGQESSQQVVP
jgi:heavy metal sensor kinase